MSEEMAEKKRAEIAAVEKEKVDVMSEIAEDMCPACKLPTSQVEFFNETIIKAFGWIECTRCGNVYSPKSIMKQKRAVAKSGITPVIQTPSNPPSRLIVE